MLIDHMGLADLSYYGSTFYETPHIDRLAKDGMKFTPAYSACTVCSPTRGALLRGEAITPRPIYWHYPHYHPGGATPYSAVREGDWRLVHFYEDNRADYFTPR